MFAAGASKAIGYYVARFPLMAGTVASAALVDAHRATNAMQNTGPQLAVETMTAYLIGWRDTGALESDAPPLGAIALRFCGSA